MEGQHCGQLGASRGRLVRQLLIENLLLFLAGGVLGLFMARWSIDSLHALAAASGYIPERLAVDIDVPVRRKYAVPLVAVTR